MYHLIWQRASNVPELGYGCLSNDYVLACQTTSKGLVEKESYVLNNLFLCAFQIVSPTNSSNLPECDSKGPHIRGSGELASCDALNGHPLEGQVAPGLLHIHLLNLPRETKVRSLPLATGTLRQAKSQWTIFKLAKYSCTHEGGREGEREGGREGGREGRLQR